MGYRVFDTILDNSYDRIPDHTERWKKLCGAIEQSQYRLKDRFEVSRADIEHNQQLFLQHKTQRLNILLEQLNESY
jgi:hypothetical protein